MRGKQRNKTKRKENESSQEKEKWLIKYYEYEQKWTQTEIYNEGPGVDMIVNI